MVDVGETAVPAGRMTREQYHAWTERQPRGRFERIDGEVVVMAPERVTHLRVSAKRLSLDPPGIAVDVSTFLPD